MRTVEHWWNGRWLVGRRDLWLSTDGRLWFVRVRLGFDKVTLLPYEDEAGARDQLAALLSERGPWRTDGT